MPGPTSPQPTSAASHDTADVDTAAQRSIDSFIAAMGTAAAAQVRHATLLAHVHPNPRDPAGRRIVLDPAAPLPAWLHATLATGTLTRQKYRYPTELLLSEPPSPQPCTPSPPTPTTWSSHRIPRPSPGGHC